MTDTQTLLILIGAMIVIAFVLPHIIMNRTIPKVIKILREHNAVGEEHAVAAKDMGLTPKPYMQRVLRTKDHKPRALQILIQLEIVKQNPDGTVYLSEEGLAKTKWSHL